ncbi:MAG TPA: M20/M25/M40 family metallo-hydrolase [Kofleriaceae bacterium]|nr:M20/M25/M40 family metallo-hydrolase [Kofleriaceae bacterium]
MSPPSRNPLSDPRQALARARALLPRHLDLLARLVELDSTAAGAGGHACVALCDAALTELGFAAGAPGAPGDRHLVRERAPTAAGGAPRATLLVVGHLDTVLPGGPGTLHRDGARWRGPGVIDMKGGVVTALLSLALAREAGALDTVRVRVALNGDEETGSATGGPIVRAAARGADVALCFEAARDGGGVVVARKGLGTARIEVRGRTGHAGIDHDRAANAFSALCRLIARAEDLERTLAVSVSPGGAVAVSPRALNAIPAHATCELEWRFFDAAAGGELLPALRAAGAEIAAATGAEIAIEGAIEVPPMQPSAATHALLARYQAAAAALGLTIDGAATAGVGDMNEIAALGPACLDGVGPEGGAMHSTDEWLAVDTIAERAAMNALAIAAWSSELAATGAAP